MLRRLVCDERLPLLSISLSLSRCPVSLLASCGKSSSLLLYVVAVVVVVVIVAVAVAT